MLARILDHLTGYERLRHRGDQLFLSGKFDEARRQYARAHGVLSARDHRRSAIDSLMRQCDEQRGVGVEASAVLESLPRRESESEFHAGLEDIFELAIGDKTRERADLYRGLGDDFKAGYVALVQGDAPRAVRSLAAASTSYGSSFVAHLEHGRALSLGGEMEQAAEALRRAERLGPDDREVKILASAIDIELQRFEPAKRRLSNVSDPEPEVSFLLGKALAGLRLSDEALEQFRSTVNREPQFHEAYFEGSRLVGANGDRQAQLELLSRACALAPDEVAYNRELATLVVGQELDEEAGLAACDRLLATDDDNAWQYLYWVAELYIRRGWRKEARDPLTKALKLLPGDQLEERHRIEARLFELEQPGGG